MSKVKKKVKSRKVEAYFALKAKRKRRKKMIFLTLILIVTTVVILLKAPIFAIKGANISGNKMIKKEGVINQASIKGKNIFLTDTNLVKEEVLKNPYIKSAEITRKLPNLLDIKITERKMFYKVKSDSKIYVLNNELYIMEILDDDKNLSLVEIEGLDISSVMIGEKITDDAQATQILLDIATKLIDKNKDSIFTNVNISNKHDITIDKGDVEIILGKAEDLDAKYKKAIQILTSENIKLTDGYIDVSVIEEPVIKNNNPTEEAEVTE